MKAREWRPWTHRRCYRADREAGYTRWVALRQAVRCWLRPL